MVGKGKRKSAESEFKNENGIPLTNPRDISNEFNSFFVNVGPKFASSINNNGKHYYDYLHDMRYTRCI